MKMRSKKLCLIPVVMAVAFLGQPYAFGCNVCHSKNPKMVNMHRELGFKDCFSCHGIGGKKSPEERKQQMVSEERCTGCHKK